MRMSTVVNQKERSEHVLPPGAKNETNVEPVVHRLFQQQAPSSVNTYAGSAACCCFRSDLTVRLETFWAVRMIFDHTAVLSISACVTAGAVSGFILAPSRGASRIRMAGIGAASYFALSASYFGKAAHAL